MSYELNDKIKNLTPYQPIMGDFKIRLDANECTDNYDKDFMEIVHSAVDKIKFNRYPDPSCINLRKSFADYYGVDYRHVNVGNGSDELIFVLESAFLKKGDKFLVVSPDFSMYEFYCSITENKCIKSTKNKDLKINVSNLIDIINTENIKMVMFSNPCNPTGQGMSKNDVIRLVTSVNALVVLDEAYMDFWGETHSLLKIVHTYSNIVILRTASKAIGSAGLRLGFAIANEDISRAIMAVKSPYNVNSLSQEIGTELYKNKKYLKNRTKTIVKYTKKLYNDLLEISNNIDDFKVFPTKANFVLVKTGFGKELWEYLKSKSVVIRYMGDYIRITTGNEEEINETVSLIKSFLSER